METGACGLSMFSCLILVSRRISQPLMHNYILATAFFAQSSLSFVLAKVWDHQWWLAHIIFASGFLLVSYGVIRAFLTTGAFSTVYSYEKILAQLKEELQARTRAEQEIADREKKLIEAHATVMLAAEVAHLGVWSWTLADNSLNWNPQMFKLFGLAPPPGEQVVNYADWRSLLHADDLATTEALLMLAVEGKGQFDTVFRIIWPDGSVRYLQSGAFVERDANGSATRLIGINFDITDNKEFESNLLEAKRLAEQASITKGQFLANMSHEIRTPMNAVLGMLQLLRQTALEPRQADYAVKAQTAARSLLGLLNDILDFSKIEAGKMELDLHPFDLDDLMRDLAVVLSANLGEKNIELVFDVGPTLPRSVIGDQLRLQQILINLAGNAIKFTQHGQVVISVQALTRDHDQVSLQIAVTDSGIGISSEQLGHIFDGFTQAEASTTRRFGGTGLGLAISKRLVNLMGAELRVASEPGKGSRFWFDVVLDVDHDNPLAMPDNLSLQPGSAANPPSPQRATARLHGMRILVVEDNALNRQVVDELLRGEGAHVTLAEDGTTGVARATEQVGQFDVVIMDVQMPDIDGLEATRRIRTDARFQSLPILAMTANASSSDRIECLDAGMDEHIAKPIALAEVVPMLLALTGRIGDPTCKV
jgi:PAS domain S-box-containing protein